MPSIKLPPIPAEEPVVRVMLSIPRSRYQLFQRYVEFFNETHGSVAGFKAVLPHLIEAFIRSDRAFARSRGRRPTAAPSITAERPPDLIEDRSSIA